MIPHNMTVNRMKTMVLYRNNQTDRLHQFPTIDQNTSTTLTKPDIAAVQYVMVMKEVQKSNELIKGLNDCLKKTEDKIKYINFRISRKGKCPAKKTPMLDDVKVRTT